MRDRLNLLSSKSGIHISYNNYLPAIDIDNVLEEVIAQDTELEGKNQLFDYIFSVRKDNRNLQKRIQSFEQDEQKRRDRAKIVAAQEYQQWQDSHGAAQTNQQL